MLKPYDDSVATWCEARQQEICQAAQTPRDQLPDLEKVILDHVYHAGDISDWPNDRCLILPLTLKSSSSSQMKENYYLGSLAACKHLSPDSAASDRTITCVVSFCAKEMIRIHGQPEIGWNIFFQQVNIHWISFDLDDQATIPGYTNIIENVGEDWLSAWIEMCVDLMKHLEKNPEQEHSILFHCCDGINSSSAGLCAWMIFRRHISAKQAIQSVLKARPSLKPWQDRPHVLWALHVWEMDQEILRPQILGQVKMDNDQKYLLGKVDYLERWSWRTWELLQSYIAHCKSLEGQVESLQKEIHTPKRKVEDMRDIDDEGSKCGPEKKIKTQDKGALP